MAFLKRLWLRHILRGLDMQIAEAEWHARHFAEMAEHHRQVRAAKAQELDNLDEDRP